MPCSGCQTLLRKKITGFSDDSRKAALPRTSWSWMVHDGGLVRIYIRTSQHRSRHSIPIGNKNCPKHVQTRAGRRRMARPDNNMWFRSIEETREITLINLYLFIQNHWKTIVVGTKWKQREKKYCCWHLKKSMCLSPQSAHHLAPVAQSVRASCL